jgi:hypothetical protein
VLRATEEIMVLLEDMGLNLQSMMASPFVRPFLSEVRGWEQKLSLIGEWWRVMHSGVVGGLSHSVVHCALRKALLPCCLLSNFHMGEQ